MQADDAERALLGAVLRDPSKLSALADIHPDHLRLPEHGALLRLMRDRAAQGLSNGMVELPVAVSMAGNPTLFGGVHYVVEHADYCPSPEGVHSYATTALEAAARRHVGQTSAIISEALEGGYSAKETLEQIETHLRGTPRASSTGRQSLADCVRQSMRRLEIIDEGETQHVPMPTGLPVLDEALNGGLHPGKFHIIGARPGMGKTALGMQMALNVVADAVVAGRTAVVISAEMTARDLGDRVLAAAAKVSPRKIANGSGFTTEEWRRLYHAEQQSEEAWSRIQVDDTSTPSFQHIRRVCEAQRRTYGRLDLVMVDYFQILDAGGDSRAHVQALNRLSTSLLGLARELQCAVVLLSQLNRSPTVGRLPEMSDLKGSGQQEQDAHVILLPYRPGADDENRDPSEALIIVAKNRSGPAGQVHVTWDSEYMRFTEKGGDPFGID